MKTLLRLLVVLVVLGGVGYAAWGPAMRYWRQRNQPKWRTVEVTEGPILSVVNSTGTVKPVLSVQVGAFVSGPIVELRADFNQPVAKGEMLARIDPQLYEANVARDRATLASRQADVARVSALLQQAIRDEQRAIALQEENEDFIAQSEMDRVHFNALQLKAQLKLAEAAVEQAKAALVNSETNLEYTNIRSPVAGIVIDRKIDEGQTLAAQFQTPELFVVAPNMEEKMHIFASVDEADIGLIRQAQTRALPVEFRVDAYPEELFQGTIEQIRMSSSTVQNVVTYPVVVATPNPDLKLLPGMTASISFEVDSRDKVMRIPNSALRFYPQLPQVHPDDRYLLEGTGDDSEDTESEVTLTAAERAEANRERARRHVWIVDGQFVRAVEVRVGLTDNRYSELVEGQLKAGAKLVSGVDK